MRQGWLESDAGNIDRHLNAELESFFRFAVSLFFGLCLGVGVGLGATARVALDVLHIFFPVGPSGDVRSGIGSESFQGKRFDVFLVLLFAQEVVLVLEVDAFRANFDEPAFFLGVFVDLAWLALDLRVHGVNGAG